MVVVSGNTQSWHQCIRRLLEDDRKAVKQFATLLVNSFPEIFKDLSRTLNTDGTLALR